MKIRILTVGKIKEKFYRDAIAEYQKRLGRYCKLEIVEVADEKDGRKCQPFPDGAGKGKRGTAASFPYSGRRILHCARY